MQHVQAVEMLYGAYITETSTFEYWTLDTTGNWHGAVPQDNSFFITTEAGQILWPSIHTVVPADSVEQGWRLTGYEKANSQLFGVTIRREKEERMGVWDVNKKQWAWKPEHPYIRCLDAELGYWTFKSKENEKYGLFQLQTRKELIPQKYHDMRKNGMVSYDNEQHSYSMFYVDWDTRREYRDK